MGNFLKKNKKEINKYKKYSFITDYQVQQMKDRCLEIKEEIDLLSKQVSYKNVKEISKLSNEFIDITKELRLYEKYTKIREYNERNDLNV